MRGRMIGKLPVFTLLTLLLAVTACQKQPLAEPAPDALDPTSEYIIVFGDIQGYTVSSSAMKWYTSTQHWIQTAQHRYGNIRCVLHVGDTTEHNQEAEWLRFWDATDSTAKVVPFYNAIGNHDYEWDWQGYIPDRDATFFTTYSSFPQTLAHVEEAFEPGIFVLLSEAAVGHPARCEPAGMGNEVPENPLPFHGRERALLDAFHLQVAVVIFG